MFFIIIFIILIMTIISFCEVITLIKYYNYLREEFTTICIEFNNTQKRLIDLEEMFKNGKD